MSDTENACLHPEEMLEESISHLGDPDWAYCYGCRHVLRLENGEWKARPTGIKKAVYRYGK